MNARLKSVLDQVVSSGIPVQIMGALAGNPVSLGAIAAKALPLVVQLLQTSRDPQAPAESSVDDDALASALEQALATARARAGRELDAATGAWELVYRQADEQP